MKKFSIFAILALHICASAQEAELNTLQQVINQPVATELSTNELLQKIVDNPDHLKALYQLAPEIIENFVIKQKIDEAVALANADSIKEKVIRNAELTKNEQQRKAKMDQLEEETKERLIAFEKQEEAKLKAELERKWGPHFETAHAEFMGIKKNSDKPSPWLLAGVGAIALIETCRFTIDYVIPALKKS